MDKDTFFRKKRSINCGGKYLDLSSPKVMGILNVTPDSFYDGGKYQTPAAIKKKVNELLTGGADIIDVGAYSSRPGANHITETEELNRLSKALEVIRSEFPDEIISVDTFRSGIARKVVHDFGVNIVNDIAGGKLDVKMFESLVEMQVPYILMHIQGTPQTMKNQTSYTDLIKEVIVELGLKAEKLKASGLHDIIIDPGFGFGKTLDQNYQILSHLQEFQVLELPVLVGVSRKSMIYNLLNVTSDEALPGTIVLHTLALERGADIIRAHDVREAQQAIKIYKKLKTEGEKYIEQCRNSYL